MAGLGNGSRLGPYRILDRVAVGGMGIVYRARDTRLGRDVAVKTLADFLAGDVEAIHRFQLEAQAVSALAHPNVLTIYDVGSHKGTPYQVSEFLNGETLRSRLERGKMGHEEALKYTVQFASGLAAAHDAGIVHRDLKPENLFITADERLKILDFGLAKLLPQARIVPERAMGKPGVPDMKTQQGTIIGTVAYMSPEQVQGAAADRRSDVFAFGSILYEMLCGEPAFSRNNHRDLDPGEHRKATAMAIVFNDPAPIPDVPPALEQIVRRCLHKKREERFQSGRELERALKALHPSGSDHGNGGTGDVRPSDGIPPPPPDKENERRDRSPPRQRLPPLRIALPALGLVAAAVIIYLIRPPTPPPAPATPPRPPIEQITFRRGTVWSARFAPDGESVVYSAAWDGKPDQTQTVMPGKPAGRSLDLKPARVLSVSRSGELAISLDDQGGSVDYMRAGTLARVPLAGGAPRELLTDVLGADWDAQGAELAVVRVVGGKTRVEYPPGKVLYASDGWISNPRLSSQGQIAFIEHPFFGDTRGVVMRIDAAGKASPLTPVLGSAMGLAWSIKGDEVWFTGGDTAQSAALRAVALDGKQRVIQQMAGSLFLHDIARDGSLLLARESWRHLIRGVPPGKKQEQDFSWQDYSLARELSADGRKLLFFEAGQAGGEHFSAYVRALDGSAPVLLGHGYALSITADGKWVLLVDVRAPSELNVVPTGAGESRKLSLPVAQIAEARWFPDGKNILLTARESAGGPLRIYVMEAATARLRPLTEAGLPGQELLSRPVSPDGGRVLVVRADGFFLYRTEGGEPERVEGLIGAQVPMGWHPDGASLFVREPGLPLKVSRLDLKTRRQEPWRELMPPDSAGVSDIPWMYFASSPAGEAYVYSYPQILSELYIYRRVQ
jgi:serine/threonine protein kinase